MSIIGDMYEEFEDEWADKIKKEIKNSSNSEYIKGLRFALRVMHKNDESYDDDRSMIMSD